MEIISVVMLSFAVCFITFIITLVFFNFISLMSDEDKSKIAEKSKDLGLAAKVLSDKPKIKVLTREYDSPNKQDSQELFDTGNMSPIRGHKCDNFVVDDCSWYQREVNEITEKYLETVPSHNTRVKLRKKRKSKQEK